MRVFIAGATGAIGKSLVPQLVANGHDVTGTTTSEAKLDQLRAARPRPSWSTCWTARQRSRP